MSFKKVSFFLEIFQHGSIDMHAWKFRFSKTSLYDKNSQNLSPYRHPLFNLSTWINAIKTMQKKRIDKQIQSYLRFNTIILGFWCFLFLYTTNFCCLVTLLYLIQRKKLKQPSWKNFLLFLNWSTSLYCVYDCTVNNKWNHAGLLLCSFVIRYFFCWWHLY